jgi:hypothetical protein
MNSNRVYNVTGLYCETDSNYSNVKGSYPQIGGDPASKSFHATYWRCVIVYFASSFKNNPDASRIFFTNVDYIPDIGILKTEKMLLDMGVNIIKLPFSYQPPIGYCDTWRNTFYKFDMIKQMSQICNPQDQCIILDSDCVWVKSGARLVSEIQQHGLLTYELYYDPNHKVSGLNRLDMREIYRELDNKPINFIPHYYGAEIIAAKGTDLLRVANEIDDILGLAIIRHKEGQLTLYTEEHILSYIYYKLGYFHATGNPYIKRIWTSSRFNTTCQEDLNLDIWHIPSEKLYGLKRLATKVSNQSSLFWNLTDENFVKYLGFYLGIPKRTRSKNIVDFLDAKIVGLKQRMFKN